MNSFIATIDGGGARVLVAATLVIIVKVASFVTLVSDVGIARRHDSTAAEFWMYAKQQ